MLLGLGAWYYLHIYSILEVDSRSINDIFMISLNFLGQG